MELVVNLPLSQWYRYAPTYWGLDYPPLTAWHSLLCGTVYALMARNGSARWLDERWMALDTSRGFESDALKLFMRASSWLSDLIIYIPAVIAFFAIYKVRAV